MLRQPGLLAVLVLFLLLCKRKRCRVDAKSLTRWPGAVWKYVPQVRPTPGTRRLDPSHPVGAIFVLNHCILRDRLVKARPARPRLELRLRRK